MMLLRAVWLPQAFKLYHAIDTQLKDTEWKWECTDHNVRAGCHTDSTTQHCTAA
jgi:hypothetical protein